MSTSFSPQKAATHQRPASMKRRAKPGTTTAHQQKQQREQAQPQTKKQQLAANTHKQQQQQLETTTHKQMQQMQSAGPQGGWRLELFFKSPEELSRQLPFLRKHGLLSLNITNKTADDDLLGVLTQLCNGLRPHPQNLQQQQATTPAPATSGSAAAQLDVCLHYSLKYNYDKTPERSLARLLDFCQDLQTLLAQQQQSQQMVQAQVSLDSSSASGSRGSSQPGSAVTPHVDLHVLLVSGGGKKKKFDSVAALQGLQQHIQQQGGSAGKTCLPSLAVAFNPYLPDPAAAAEERKRLKAKLHSGLVDRVYLQMGTDLQQLRSGLAYIQHLVQELTTRQPALKAPLLLGSVFLPSKRLLAQMRFRPWNGVFLSEEYLGSVEAAEGITRELLDVYASAGVLPLLESAVKTDAELSHARELLGVAVY